MRHRAVGVGKREGKSMGRYVTGDAGFQYKYLFGRQGSNLHELGGSPGRAWLVPAFAVTSDAREETRLVPLMPILRAAVAATEDETDLDDFVTASDALYHGGFEHLVAAIETCFSAIAPHFDAGCPWAAGRARLEAYAHYEIRRSDWEAMRRWIADDRLKEGELTLEMLRGDGLPEHLLVLREVDDALPFLALRILHHAVRLDLDALHVWESDPGQETTEIFWEHCGEQLKGSDDTESTFVAALVTHFQGLPSRDGFAQAVKQGSAAARRWLALLDGSPSTAPPASPAKPEVSTPRLAGLIARNEVGAEYRSASRGGDVARRVRAIEAAATVTDPHLHGEILVTVAEEGSVEEAKAALALLPKLEDSTKEDEGFYIVLVALRAGDHATAFNWLRNLVERARQAKDLLSDLRDDPQLVPLRGDPRWHELFTIPIRK